MGVDVAAWWRENRVLVVGTIAVGVILGLGAWIWAGPRAGVLVCGAVIALMGVLMVSSASMSGSNQILDRQIAMRERDEARARGEQPPG